MGRKIDLTGQRFGKWTVLEECEDRDKYKRIWWECLCECGEQRKVSGKSLKAGQSKSCGCIKDENLTGQRFGKLIVLRKSEEKGKQGNTSWDCVCDCGNHTKVITSLLKNGNTKSCCCKRNIDLTGQRFGKLIVLRKSGKNRHYHTIWDCVCDCGNSTKVKTSNLNSGNTKSCGCLTLEMIGDKHPKYNPNIPDEERMFGRYQLYGTNPETWRNDVYSTDSYTCQGCGDNSGGNLNAHHLNSWNAFPEQRFDTANGITLCSDCHKEFHHFNGYGNNTIEQFRDHIACMVGEEHISEIEETLLSRESEIIGQEQEETRELQVT